MDFQTSTRYGAKPVHQNTFVHYHAPLVNSQSQGGLLPKKFVPFNLGAEEKIQKIRSEENKINSLKKAREQRESWIRNAEENRVVKDAQKNYNRAIIKEEYEKKCKLTSPFSNMSIE